MRVAIGLLFLMVLAQPASAADKNNIQWLYTQCKQNSPLCIAYIEGVADMMALASVSPDKVTRGTLGMCAPDGTTYGADVQVLINWAEKHPEQWTQVQIVGVIGALGETWPCH